MASYLLDSSVIIDAINGKRERLKFLRELVEQHHRLGCCAINVTEVYAGMLPHEESRTEELLESLDYFDITWDVAKKAGLLKRDLARKGKTLALADVTIAAVAIENSLTLITDNLKDYPMKEIKLYPWK